MTRDPDTRLPLDSTALGDLPPPFTVEVRESVPSTNELVADLARDGAGEGLVVVAEHQTAGRGRLGRDWQTPARAALTFSVLLRPAVEPRRWPLLSLLAGVAVREGIAASSGPPVLLKWPNDVLADDGLKVAGLLLERIETDQGPSAVVGIGLNVSSTRAELPVDTAGSLVTAGMLDPDRTLLLRRLLEAFARRYAEWTAGDDEPVLEAYAAGCDTLGRDVEVRLPGERTLRGRAVRLDRDGALVVEDDAGTHTIHAGDVVHVRVP